MKPLSIQQDLVFQHRQWRIERIGWAIIASLIVAGFLGAFGHHPLTTVTGYTSDQRLSIEYDRFIRHASTVDFQATIEPDNNGSDIVRLWFDPHYLDTLKVIAVSPLPLRGEARDGGRAFVFQTDGSRFTATVSVQFETRGLVQGRVWTHEGETLSLRHFVWP